MRLTTLIIGFWFPLISIGQISGEVNYERLGISFVIPEGWVGQESEDVLIMGSETVSGFLVMQAHNLNLEQLKKEAYAGIDEGNGTQLKLEGDYDSGPDYIGGVFNGTVEWEAAKGYLIGVTNSIGMGVMIMGVTAPDKFDDKYKELCFKIYNSIKFSEVDLTAEFEEWKAWLSDARLTYMSSHYSSDYTAGGISSGYSSERKIDLCSKGYFNDSSNNDMTISGSGVSGYSYGSDGGSGSWNLEMTVDGGYVLTLNYSSGEIEKYDLTYEDSKFYMNGVRYFVTSEGDYAPNCD